MTCNVLHDSHHWNFPSSSRTDTLTAKGNRARFVLDIGQHLVQTSSIYPILLKTHPFGDTTLSWPCPFLYLFVQMWVTKLLYLAMCVLITGKKNTARKILLVSLHSHCVTVVLLLYNWKSHGNTQLQHAGSRMATPNSTQWMWERNINASILLNLLQMLLTLRAFYNHNT